MDAPVETAATVDIWVHAFSCLQVLMGLDICSENDLLGNVAGTASVRVAVNRALLLARSGPWKSRLNDAVNSHREEKTPALVRKLWLLDTFADPPSRQRAPL